MNALSAADSAHVGFVAEAWRRHLRLAVLLTGDQGHAEELLQDSLVKVYERWRRLAKRDDVHAYLRRVITNNHISMWRRRRREDLVADVPDRAGREFQADPHADRLRPTQPLDEPDRARVDAIRAGERPAALVIGWIDDRYVEARYPERLLVGVVLDEGITALQR